MLEWQAAYFQIVSVCMMASQHAHHMIHLSSCVFIYLYLISLKYISSSLIYLCPRSLYYYIISFSPASPPWCSWRGPTRGVSWGRCSCSSPPCCTRSVLSPAGTASMSAGPRSMRCCYTNLSTQNITVISLCSHDDNDLMLTHSLIHTHAHINVHTHTHTHTHTNTADFSFLLLQCGWVNRKESTYPDYWYLYSTFIL